MKVWLKAATCVVGIGLPLLCGCSSAPSGTGSFKLTKSQISRFGNKQEIVTRNSDRCVDKSGGITYNLMSCGGVAIDGYQSIIDEIVIIKNSTASPAEIQRLSSSQASWLASAKKHCEDDSDVRDGGTAGAVSFNACIADAFDHRVTQLIGARQ